MSDFLAEARVIIHPDTTRFRAELLAQIGAATATPVPVRVTPIVTGTTNFAAITAGASTAAIAVDDLAAAEFRAGAEATKATRAQAAHTQQLGQVRTAALASFASMTGLRGAVLTAGGAFLGATIAIQSFTKAVQSAAELETNLNVFRVTAGATADEMQRVRDEAVALGRDIRLPAVSAGDAAEAITLLARAGLTVEDSLAGARGVLQLATAAQIDNATATELAASALNAFALAGEDAVAVADLLANSANLSQGSITDVGIALRQSAGAAAQVGLSLEDTVTVLTALARTGLAGSDAGTTLRVALLRLVAPTKDAQKALERFNIDLRDATGNLRVEALFELEEALRGVTRAEADRIRVAIFGQNAFRVSALLGRESVQSFQELEDAVTKQGAAAELAGARTQGFAGQMEALSSNLETLGTNLGTLVLPPLSVLVQTLNEFVGTAGAAVEGTQAIASGIEDIAEEAGDAIPLLNRLKDALQETFLRGLDPTRRPRQAIAALGDVIGRFGSETKTTASSVENDVRDMFAAFSESGGLGSPTALNEFVNGLDDLADRLAKGEPEAQKLARRIRELIKELQSPATFVVDLDLDFDRSDLRSSGAQAGQDTAEGALQSLRAAGSQVGEIGLDWINDLAGATVPAATKAGSDTGDAFVKGFNDAQIRGQLQAQRTAVAQAQAFGETGLEELIAERDRIDRILNSAKAPTGPALEALFEARRSVVEEINRILEDQADAAEEVRDKAEQARDRRDRAILDAIGLEEQRRVNAVLRAQATASANDDLKAQIALRNFYKQAIAEVRKTVNDAKLAAQIIAGLIADQIRANEEIEQAKEDLKEERRRERREERERRRESLSLDVQIAEARGNQAAEIRAREAEIAFLKEQIATTRAGSNQRKRLILEIQQAERELRELQGAKKDANNAAAEFFFSQLQAQQGFAANLLGNLITGPTAGLVGVPSPTADRANIPDLGARVGAEVGAATGRAQIGPTAGQTNAEIDILRAILNQLKVLNGSHDAPEAINQRKSMSASGDGVTYGF